MRREVSDVRVGDHLAGEKRGMERGEVSVKICLRCQSAPRVGYKYCRACRLLAYNEQRRAWGKSHPRRLGPLCLQCGAAPRRQKFCSACGRERHKAATAESKVRCREA